MNEKKNVIVNKSTLPTKRTP